MISLDSFSSLTVTREDLIVIESDSSSESLIEFSSTHDIFKAATPNSWFLKALVIFLVIKPGV